jgi:hypothetical protein
LASWMFMLLCLILLISTSCTCYTFCNAICSSFVSVGHEGRQANGPTNSSRPSVLAFHGACNNAWRLAL